MALTQFSDLFASIHENAINNVVLQLQRQRPSLFNYGTDAFVQKPDRLCYPLSNFIDVDVTLFNNPVVQKDSEAFDTRKLGKDDLVVFRPFHPGKYKLLNRLAGQETSFAIEEKKDGGYINPAKLEPVTIPLTSKGFEMPKNGIQPFQAIVIKPDIDCSLLLEMEKPRGKKKKTN